MGKLNVQVVKVTELPSFFFSCRPNLICRSYNYYRHLHHEDNISCRLPAALKRLLLLWGRESPF